MIDNRSGAIIIEGHVQGLSNVRALGEQGVPVYVMDVCHCLAQHSKYCKKYFRCPAFDSDDFIDFLLEVGKKEHLKDWVLLPSNDHIVENLSKNKERLHPYYKTIAPEPDILDKIVSKRHLLEVAESCGVPIPATCYPSSIEKVGDFRFPILIKGVKGLSFYKAIHAKAIQVDELRNFHAVMEGILQDVEADNVMIQELIPDDQAHSVVSFTCFAEQGEIMAYWMGKKLREHPLKYGTATMSQSVFVPEILVSAKPLIKSLCYTGVCEVEFMFDPRDGEYKLIEINPRTWLWVGLAKACGVNYALMVYNYLNGIQNDYPSGYHVGTKWINWMTDAAFGIKGILKGNYSVSGYFSLLSGKKVKAVWSWKDVAPGLAFPFMSFYIAKKRK